MDKNLNSSETRTTKSKLAVISGCCGIFGPVLTIVMVFAATYISPWFRWDTNALSELGVGEVSLLFNAAVFIGGMLSFFFVAFGLIDNLPGGRLVRAGVASIVIGSVCLALVGIFTIAYPALHGIVSSGYFVLAPIGFIMIGFDSKENTVRKLSIAAGIAALSAILVLPIIFLSVRLKIGFAVPEMIETWIIAIWLLFMAAKLVRT